MKKTKKNPLILITLVAVLGIGAYAFADWEGSGMGGYGGRGMGYHMGWGAPGYGYQGNLSEQDYRQIEAQQRKFFDETESLRREIYEKQLALQTEMARENPDAAKAGELQKQLSKLESEFNQKRIDHMIELRKSNPDIARGLAQRGPARGYGGPGGMMGYGPGGCDQPIGDGTPHCFNRDGPNGPSRLSRELILISKGGKQNETHNPFKRNPYRSGLLHECKKNGPGAIGPVSFPHLLFLCRRMPQGL